jgi:hypothetical protein
MRSARSLYNISLCFISRQKNPLSNAAADVLDSVRFVDQRKTRSRRVELPVLRCMHRSSSKWTCFRPCKGALLLRPRWISWCMDYCCPRQAHCTRLLVLRSWLRSTVLTLHGSRSIFGMAGICYRGASDMLAAPVNTSFCTKESGQQLSAQDTTVDSTSWRWSYVCTSPCVNGTKLPCTASTSTGALVLLQQDPRTAAHRCRLLAHAPRIRPCPLHQHDTICPSTTRVLEGPYTRWPIRAHCTSSKATAGWISRTYHSFCPNNCQRRQQQAGISHPTSQLFAQRKMYRCQCNLMLSSTGKPATWRLSVKIAGHNGHELCRNWVGSAFGYDHQHHRRLYSEMKWICWMIWTRKR